MAKDDADGAGSGGVEHEKAMTQPKPTPDDVRAAIAQNPQSQSDRSYLINQAVNMNMADEIPNDWTVEYFDPDVDGKDDIDLIADDYKVTMSSADPNGNPIEVTQVAINAHESGQLSISVPPDYQTALTKFDTAAADRLIEMMDVVTNITSGAHRGETPTVLREPSTGITIDFQIGTIAVANRLFVFDFKKAEHWHTGLSAMANAAEVYEGRNE